LNVQAVLFLRIFLCCKFGARFKRRFSTHQFIEGDSVKVGKLYAKIDIGQYNARFPSVNVLVRGAYRLR
jgi:hypothetical protein